MECQAASERLPFLLNGSLEEAERNEVLVHLRDCEACRGDLRDAAYAWAATDAHPPAEVLLDYAQGRELAEFPRHVLEQHFAGCEACSLAIEAASGHAAAPTALDEHRRRTPTAPSRRWRTLALAASLAFVALCGGWLWSRFTQPSSPTANVVVAELVAASENERGTASASQGRGIALPAGRDAALILLPPTSLAGSAFRVVIEAPNGREIQTLAGLEPSSSGDFTLLLPASSLPPGPLILRLEERRGTAWSEFAEYRLVVED